MTQPLLPLVAPRVPPHVRPRLRLAGAGATSSAATARLGAAEKQPHFAPKAKSVIWLFMTGGPSQVDTFDYKPDLQKRDGQTLAGADPKTGFFTTSGKCLASPFKWAQHGKSGSWVSDVFPQRGEARRRHGLHPLVPLGGEQPRPGVDGTGRRRVPAGLPQPWARG